jgi:aminopeptidase N
VDGFKPEGWVNATIYIPGGYSAYRDAVYLNGAKFMQELRNLTGDDAFFAALQQYTLQNTYKIASESDFFKALRNHSSADLNPLLQKYFENPPAY